mmetsp:Transcript_9456/g.33470  ORF Transcript_9456/g.33470 Transcript_9456/m.33470 type:complete len:288 (-) Transcript_9456:301-1164(-)
MRRFQRGHAQAQHDETRLIDQNRFVQVVDAGRQYQSLDVFACDLLVDGCGAVRGRGYVHMLEADNGVLRRISGPRGPRAVGPHGGHVQGELLAIRHDVRLLCHFRRRWLHGHDRLVWRGRALSRRHVARVADVGNAPSAPHEPGGLHIATGPLLLAHELQLALHLAVGHEAAARIAHPVLELCDPDIVNGVDPAQGRRLRHGPEHADGFRAPPVVASLHLEVLSRAPEGLQCAHVKLPRTLLAIHALIARKHDLIRVVAHAGHRGVEAHGHIDLVLARLEQEGEALV